jgi:hypothetical protein
MRPLLKNRITIVWMGLLAATALSLMFGHGLWFSEPRQAGVAILIIAFIKVRLVILDFMEVRHAPRYLRRAAHAWIVTACAVLIALFLSRHR